MITTTSLIGKGKKPVSAKMRFDVPVGTITWSAGKVLRVNLKFHKKAAEVMDLSALKIEGKDYFKSVSFYETEDGKIGVFNSTPYESEVVKSEVSAMHNVKLLKIQIALLSKLYEFKEGENWAFKLVQKKDEFLGKPIETFIFEKLQRLEDSKPREKSEAQEAQIAETKAWFESERELGRTPTIERYWDERALHAAS